MSAPRDGGPAYPSPVDMYGGKTESAVRGMSLRDAMAIAAMQGICAHPDTWGLGEYEIAAKAYEIAAVMLAERAKVSG